MLLLAEVNPILEEQSRKKYAFRVYDIGDIKIVFSLSTKVVALHIGATILQVRVSSLKSLIPEGGIYFAMFLTLNKLF